MRVTAGLATWLMLLAMVSACGGAGSPPVEVAPPDTGAPEPATTEAPATTPAPDPYDDYGY